MNKEESINAFLKAVLGFSEPWYIEGVVQDGDVMKIVLNYPKGTRFSCPQCGKEMTAYSNRWKTYRHLDWWQYKTELKVKTPRIQCCGHTITPEISWLRKGSKFTQMMESHILALAKRMPMKSVSEILGETDTKLWRVVLNWTEKCRKQADFSTLQNMGIDETSKKGHNYITNFVDLDKRKVMYVANGKNSQTIVEFACDLEKHGGNAKNVRNTTSDMSLAFESGIKREFQNSSIIIDKFHVIKYFNDALNKTLRDDIKAGRDFKKSKYIWAKNPENLTEKQSKRFKKMNARHSKTGKAYQMKIAMQEIYRLTDKNEAMSAFDKLISWMKRSRNGHMKKLAKTMLNHYENIMNYFDNRLTNAILEGINNVIQAIKHTARGFRNYDYFKAVVYLHCGAFEVSVG